MVQPALSQTAVTCRCAHAARRTPCALFRAQGTNGALKKCAVGGTPLDDASRGRVAGEMEECKARFEAMDEGADRALLHDHIQVPSPPCRSRSMFGRCIDYIDFEGGPDLMAALCDEPSVRSLHFHSGLAAGHSNPSLPTTPATHHLYSRPLLPPPGPGAPAVDRHDGGVWQQRGA